MEIDAVAECNAASVYSQRKLKTPIFSNLPGLKEPGGDMKPTKNPHHNWNADSITASLLAISDEADLDLFRQKPKLRKQTSVGDRLGPWISDDKWRPRKTVAQSRIEKRLAGRTSSLSPTRSRYAFPDDRHSKTSRVTFHKGSTYFGRADDNDHDLVQDLEMEKPSKIRPATVPYHQTPRKLKTDSQDILQENEIVQTYPKHSLPTVITLRSANSSNCYDNVFSLGKSSLSSKDIIFSMGQNNRLSTYYKRHTKSAIFSDIPTPYLDTPVSKIKEEQLGCKDLQDASSANGGSKAADVPGGRKPAPPMCEYMDISQHIRYYRIHHTVRFTGRFSLANEEPDKKEIQSVMWNDVFPNRPLSSTRRSANRVPVFRFSVSDFRREPTVAPIERICDHKNSSSPSTQALKSSDANVVSTMQKAKSRIVKAMTKSAGEIHFPTAASRKRDAKISLSPTVLPVTRSPRNSLTPEGTETEDFWRSDGRHKQLKSSSYENEGQTSINNKVTREESIHNANKDGDNKEEHMGCSYDEFPIDFRNTTHYASSKDDQVTDLKSPSETDSEYKTTSMTKPVSISKLSKTQEYIRSTYSVYNDTIRSMPGSDASQVTIYKEYLKRKKSLVNLSQCENEADCIGGDKSPLPEHENQLAKARFKSPHKFSYIFRDVMRFPRHHKMPYRNLAAPNEEDPLTPTLDEERRLDRPTSIPKPTLTINARQLRDSVERKVYEGNKFLLRPFTSRSVDDNERFVRFLVQDERDVKASLIKRKGQNSLNCIQDQGIPDVNDFGPRNLSPSSSPDRNVGTASAYDLNASCDTIPANLKETKTNGGLYINMRSRLPTVTSDSPQESTAYLTNPKKVWKPSASRWKQKLPVRPESQPTSSAFHFRPTSSPHSAYVIATPPLQMGFDNRGVVLPLDDFVHLAMKSRESSFTALSQSVNAGSKVGIAPNAVGRAKSVRKSPDDGLVRVVSFATPVNQFIFAKRITGCSMDSSLLSSIAPVVTAEDVGRNVFQRKTAGSYRLSLNDVKQNKQIFVSKQSGSQDNYKKEETYRANKTDDVETNAVLIKDNPENENEESEINPSVTEKEKSRTDKDQEEETSYIKFTDVQETNSVSTKYHPQNEKGESEIDPNVTETEKKRRQIDVRIPRSSFMNSEETDGSCKENNGELHNQNDTDAISLKDWDAIHSALRNKVVNLAETKNSQNTTLTTINDETDQDDCCRGKFNQSLHSLDVGETNNKQDMSNRPNYSLASRFSHLRQRRKNALRRHSISKQATYVRKSAPLETLTSDCLTLTPNSGCINADIIRAEGRCPWKERSSVSRSSQRPKTVRFACDEVEISASDRPTNLNDE